MGDDKQQLIEFHGFQLHSFEVLAYFGLAAGCGTSKTICHMHMISKNPLLQPIADTAEKAGILNWAVQIGIYCMHVEDTSTIQAGANHLMTAFRVT